MDKPPLVGDRAVRANEDVVCDRLAEDLDLEHVRDDLLCLAIDVGVHERDVVIAGDDVAERGEPLLNALEGDGFWEGIAQML